MRSRKLRPGSAVTRSTSQSDTMRVPPVTELKSPPDSRITGALSPVIALSSTDATPRTTSASAGMMSPAMTSRIWPCFRLADGTIVAPSCALSGAGSTRTIVSDLVARRLSARARPRPSASASAKLAISTAAHSQNAIWTATPPPDTPRARSRRPSTLTISAATAVAKMTGFLSSRRGASLASACRAAAGASAPIDGTGSECFDMDERLRRFARPAWTHARRWGPGPGPERRSARPGSAR